MSRPALVIDVSPLCRRCRNSEQGDRDVEYVVEQGLVDEAVCGHHLLDVIRWLTRSDRVDYYTEDPIRVWPVWDGTGVAP